MCHNVHLPSIDNKRDGRPGVDARAREQHPGPAEGVRVQVLLEAISEKRPLQDTSTHTHWSQVVLLYILWERYLLFINFCVVFFIVYVHFNAVFLISVNVIVCLSPFHGYTAGPILMEF